MGYLSQTLDRELAANTSYVFSAHVGVRSGNGSSPHTWSIQLLAGGILLQETTGTLEEQDHGEMYFVSGQYTSESSVESGQELEIRLVMVEGGPQLAFDLVDLVISD